MLVVELLDNRWLIVHCLVVILKFSSLTLLAVLLLDNVWLKYRQKLCLCLADDSIGQAMTTLRV